MPDRKELIEQAERTYERLARRLDNAVARGRKFPARGQWTTAYAALKGHIQRLEILQDAVRRRLEKTSGPKAVLKNSIGRPGARRLSRA